jgi:hypothetical protein
MGNVTNEKFAAFVEENENEMKIGKEKIFPSQIPLSDLA